MVQEFGLTFGAGPYKAIGRNVPNIDSFARSTGRAKFYSDYSLPGMLHVKSVHSPFPKSKILSIDGSAALALPGVKLVMSYFNFPDAFIEPYAYYAGEEVAAVVAVDEETAEKAIDLVKVEYEKDSKFVLDMLDALKADAPIVMKGAKSNLTIEQTPFWSEKTTPTAKNPQGVWGKRVMSDVGGFGDVEQGFKECDVIVESGDLQYSQSMCPKSNMRGILADYTGDTTNTTLTFYMGCKGLHADRARIADFMKMSYSKVTIICPFSEGLWGPGVLESSDRAERAARIACMASRALLKPVRHQYTQHEDHLLNWSKHSLARIKLGFKKDGSLHAMDHMEYVESGSYDASSVTSAQRTGGMLHYNRNCKHMKLSTGRVATNRLKQRDYCGIGTAPPVYSTESTMDMAAEVLGMDPIDLRKKNVWEKGGFDGAWGTTLAWNSNDGHIECYDAVGGKADWKAQWGGWGAAKTKTGVVRHGVGMASKVHTGGGWNGTSMLVRLLPEGTVQLVSSLGDSGQNEPTAACLMASEVLNIPYEKISLARGSSELPYSIMLGGSTGTWNHGYATWQAAYNCRQEVLRLASQLFNDAPVDTIDMSDKGVWLKSAPGTVKPLVDVFARLTRDPSNNNRAGSFNIEGYAYRRATDGLCVPREKGVSICHLDVDTETGQIMNIKIFTGNAIGKIISTPNILMNQGNQGVITGGRAMLMENYCDPGTGKNLCYNWVYDMAPMIQDFTADITNTEKPGDESHPYGASAASEGQPNPHLGAIANALYNAIGVRMKVAPYTPDKILKALGKI